MLAALIIVFREVFEAGLIVGIVMAVTAGVRGRALWISGGVGAGVLLCFIPIVGEFVIPDLLAGSNSLMIGQTLWLEFFTNKDWPVASASAVVLLVLLLAPLLLYERMQRRQLEAR